MTRPSLRQLLALWTLVPMVSFGLIVLALAFAWGWRSVVQVAIDHNDALARVAAEVHSV